MNKPLSETMAEHSKEVDKMLELLKDDLTKSKVVGEAPHRDTWIIRFLVGHKFNVAVAAEKFRAMVEMRVKNNVDAIREKFENGMKPNEIPGFREHCECCKATFHLQSGDAKDGSPISIMQVVQWDFDAYDKLPEELEDAFQLYQLEYQFHLLDQLALSTGVLRGFVKVIDLDQVRWEHKDRMSKVSAARKARGERLGAAGLPAPLPDCYPESTSKIRIVNAPVFASALWWIAKAFIPARTQEKIAILRKSAVQHEMLQIVDPAALPRDYGGEYEGPYLM